MEQFSPLPNYLGTGKLPNFCSAYFGFAQKSNKGGGSKTPKKGQTQIFIRISLVIAHFYSMDSSIEWRFENEINLNKVGLQERRILRFTS